MTDKPASLQNTEIAQRTQERFDAYLLGLIFTILALSIQTAKFGDSPAADASEIVGWLLLLIAGLSGLSRFEWTSEIYSLYGVQTEQESLARAIEEAATLKGVKEIYVVPLAMKVPAVQLLADAKQSVAKVKDVLEPMHKRNLKRYRVMKWGFVLGLFALIFARAFLPASGVVRAWTAP